MLDSRTFISILSCDTKRDCKEPHLIENVPYSIDIHFLYNR
jgi:hypothetical protein